MVSRAKADMIKCATVDGLVYGLFQEDRWFDIYPLRMLATEEMINFFSGPYHEKEGELVRHAEEKVWLQAAIDSGCWEFIHKMCDHVVNGL
jgi:hypothetical protein